MFDCVSCIYAGCCYSMGHSVPRRLLTQPGEPALNNGLDNAEANLIVRVNDEFVPEKSHSAAPVR